MSGEGDGRAARRAWRVSLIAVASVALVVLIAAAALAPPPPPESVDRPPIDVNTASAAELRLLPDIGPKLAESIVEHRAEHGPFETLDDLREVHRIGPRTVEGLRPYATAGP